MRHFFFSQHKAVLKALIAALVLSASALSSRALAQDKITRLAKPNPNVAVLKKKNARSAFHEAYKSWKKADDLSNNASRLVQLASAHLTAQKIAHRQSISASGHWTLVITPSTRAKRGLNRLAHSLWSRHRTKLVFDPARLARQKAVATYRRPIRGRDFGLIQLPVVSVLQPKRIHPSLAHEIIHSLTQWRLKQGKSYAFYGRVMAVNTKALPYAALVDKSGKKHLAHSYASGFSFDEIDAYFSQVSALIRDAESARSRNKRARFSRTAASRALRGYKLAVQASSLASEALAQLAEGRAVKRVRFLSQGRPQARLTFRVASRKVSVKLPLLPNESAESQLVRLKSASVARSIAFFSLLERLAPKTARKFEPHAA